MSNVIRLPRAPVAPRRWDIPRPDPAPEDFGGEGEERLAEVCASLDAKQESILSGVAGSGKTTIVKWLDHTYLIAPTAKAAHRLADACTFRSKDMDKDVGRTQREAYTVHSTVYGQPEELWIPEESLEPCQKAKQVGTSCGGCTCRLELLWPGKDIRLKAGTVLVVDEASMLNVSMVESIRHRVAELSRKVPDLKILWVGDPAQLPPVEGEPGIDLKHPDVMLTKIWRTKRPGILQLSTEIRACATVIELGAILDRIGQEEFPGVSIGKNDWKGAADWRIEGKPDARMLITWTNKNRVRLNQLVRENLKRETPIQRGDRIIIRTNNHMAAVRNGDIMPVAAVLIDEKTNTARIDAYDGPTAKRFVVMLDLLETADRDAFYRQRAHCKTPWKDDPIVNVQYGYTLTCHAAQGSQADHVGIMWTSSDMYKARKDFESAKSWLYTAVTRAQQSLTIWLVRA